jgi:hypothetical protein
LPDRIDPVTWAIHRVATSGRYTSTITEIKRSWTIVDVMDAHDVIDALAEAERKAYDRATKG